MVFATGRRAAVSSALMVWAASATIGAPTLAAAAAGDIPHVTFHRHAGAFAENLPTKKSKR